MGHYVYKYVYDGEIVYIGKNDTILENRINQHRCEEKFKPYLNSDIYYIEVANATMADVVESELIRKYKPKLNIAKMSDWCGLEFTEPEWKLFIPNKQSNKTSRTNKRKIPEKQRDKRMKLCRLMSQYYCSYMMENIFNMKETEQYYEITIPISNEDDLQSCVDSPYLKVTDVDRCYYNSISLGSCLINHRDRCVVYRFDKEMIFCEFHNVEKGLAARIKFMKNMYEKEFEELQSQE